MRIIKDISGKVYGMLTVIKPDSTGHGGRIRWLCRCECGNEKAYFKNNLDAGRSHCGCKANRASRLKHGYRNHPLYPTWASMVSRCHNIQSNDYHLYGSRGISVCERWRNDPHAFFEDMGPRPEGCSLDRINNDGNYSPENCRWATSKQQMDNRRNTAKLSDGKAIRELAEELGLKRQTVYMRKRRGWSDDEIRAGVRTAKKQRMA